MRRLQDILDQIALIETFTSGLSFEQFSANTQTVYASLHALLILSEAATKLGPEAPLLVPGQPWQAIRGIGNVLRHEYDGVDPNTVWRIIDSGDLASLKKAVRTAISRDGPAGAWTAP
jgi:uncharacterized protein with HEPN domain